jgi:hypothetical protein
MFGKGFNDGNPLGGEFHALRLQFFQHRVFHIQFGTIPNYKLQKKCLHVNNFYRCNMRVIKNVVKKPYVYSRESHSHCMQSPQR